MNKFPLRIGAIPEPVDLIPTTFTGLALAVSGGIAGTMVSDAIGLTPSHALLIGGLTALSLALGRNIETAQERRGCVLKQGGVYIQEHWENNNASHSKIDSELTALYKKALNDENALVESHQSEQYNIHVIYNDDPDTIKNRINKIARQLGKHPKQLVFMTVWGKGCSAILVHKEEQAWQAVRFNQDVVLKGRMILQAGQSVKGDTILYNREIYPHALIVGQTGAGKTEAMINDMAASRATGLNPEIFVIDPKNTPQLQRIASQRYTNDAEEGIELMRTLVGFCEERLSRYSEAKCDNYWQYHKQHPNERPLCLYIDECAELVSSDVLADPKAAKQLAKEALALITRLVQKYRSAGLFVTLGMQHPSADVLTTNIRNNIGVRIACAVEDHHAASVAGVQGAENLPMQGGMIVKTGTQRTYGRGVYLGT